MKRKYILTPALSILALVTLGCGLLSHPEPTAVPTKPPAPTKAPEPTNPPEPTTPPRPLGGSTRQWAVSATASSQYGDEGWAAKQATGAPDTPECGDSTTAWATENNDSVDWIELDYDTPVLPIEVNIVQTYSPNQVVKVELRDLQGEYHTVYTGAPQDESADCPFVLHIPVEGADKQVDGVRITVDQSVLQDWCEIDAVELVGVADRPGG
jgi:hypothetical protein